MRPAAITTNAISRSTIHTCGWRRMMHRPQRVTQTIEISEFRGQLNRFVNRVYCGETRVVVEKSGIPVTILVSADDLGRLEQMGQERNAEFAVVDELRAAFRDVPSDEIEREADRVLAASGVESPPTVPRGAS